MNSLIAGRRESTTEFLIVATLAAAAAVASYFELNAAERVALLTGVEKR